MLSADRIVELAIRHADAGGLEHVSMRRLAGELSVTPMALYWHFANRDALLEAMAEQVAGEVAHDDDPDAPSWTPRSPCCGPIRGSARSSPGES